MKECIELVISKNLRRDARSIKYKKKSLYWGKKTRLATRYYFEKLCDGCDLWL